MAKRRKKQQSTTAANGPADVSRRFFWAVAALAIALRMAYWIELKQQPDYDAPWIDAAYHDVWARQIAFGSCEIPAGLSDPEIGEHAYFRPPGYPLLLAASYRLSGGSYHAPRFLQMALVLANLALIMSLMREFASRRATKLAMVLTAVFPVSIYFDGELLAVSSLASAILLAIWLMRRWLHQPTTAKAMLAGAGLGCVCLLRPNFLLIVPAWLIILFWSRRRQPWGDQLRLVSPWLVCLGLMIAPVTLRNYIKANDPVLITSNAGINLYIGNHHESDGLSATIPDLGSISGLAGWTSFDYGNLIRGVSNRQGRPLKASQVSRHFSRLALREMARYPGHTAQLWLKKAVHFWNAREISNNKEVSLAIKSSKVLRWLPGFGWLFICAVIGIGTLNRWRNAADTPQQLLLLWLIVAFLSYLPFFVTGRFRAPLIPILCVFAGAGIDALLIALKGRSQLWRPLALTIPAALLTFGGAHYYRPNTAIWHYHQGISYETQGRDEDAASAYRSALNADPTFADAALKLGNLSYRQAKWNQARDYWEQSIRARPSPESLNNLAWLLATHPSPGERDVPRAIELAERAVEATQRRDSGKLDTLAECYRAAGQRDKARQILAEALAVAESTEDSDATADLRQRLAD